MDYDLKRLQSVEYEILKDIDAFCQKNDIEYFLFFGTLLGAARHDGFIPWDDDIDISMDRKNYHRFLKLAKKSFPSGYFIQHYSTDRKFHNSWIKVCKNNTTCIESHLTNLDIHFGISIDIFMMNGISDNRFIQRIQSFSSKTMNLLLYKYLMLAQNAELTMIQKVSYKIIPEPLRIAFIKLFDKLCSKDLSKCQKCYSTFYILKNAIVFNSSWMKPLIKKGFKSDSFFIPKHYEEILTTIYGDWKSLPPEEKRIGHGERIVVFDSSYKEYYIGK